MFKYVLIIMAGCAYYHDQWRKDEPCIRKCANQMGIPEVEILTTRDKDGNCVCAEITQRIQPYDSVH